MATEEITVVLKLDAEALSTILRGMADLSHRVAALEAKQPVHPSVSRGCVCPPGAELGCGSSGCPRKRFHFGTVTCGPVSGIVGPGYTGTSLQHGHADVSAGAFLTGVGLSVNPEGFSALAKSRAQADCRCAEGTVCTANSACPRLAHG